MIGHVITYSNRLFAQPLAVMRKPFHPCIVVDVYECKIGP